MSRSLNVDEYKHDHYLERRLEEWGRWYVDYISGTLGYPPMSVEGRIRRDGGLLSRGTKLPEPPINADAEEMDKLINALRINYPQCAQAIKFKYTCVNGAVFAANMEFYVKEQLKISLRTYFTNLRMGKMWLVGRIGK